MAIVLRDFNNLQPGNQVDQDQLSLWLSQIQTKTNPGQVNEAFIKKFAVKKTHIRSRSFFCQDLGKLDTQNNELFTQNNHFNPGLKERSNFFRDTVDDIFNHMYKDSHEAPGEILHVSCTGYVSPSAGQKLIPQKNWSDTTGITHMYHMGCYAAMPAIKVASGFASKKTIDIIHTELCSLHFAVEAHTAEQTVVQTLFADGAIKYTVAHTDSPSSGPQGIQVIQQKEKIIPGSQEAMTWAFGGNNLEMTLHRSVPLLIRDHLKDFVKSLFEEAGFNYEQDKGDFLFAIHPGGPKIIQQIVELLSLNEEQTTHSKSLLRERGNMSSATLPHIWQNIINDESVPSGAKILSVAFGPGLTVAGFIGKKIGDNQ